MGRFAISWTLNNRATAREHSFWHADLHAAPATITRKVLLQCTEVLSALSSHCAAGT